MSFGGRNAAAPPLRDNASAPDGRRRHEPKIRARGWQTRKLADVVYIGPTELRKAEGCRVCGQRGEMKKHRRNTWATKMGPYPGEVSEGGKRVMALCVSWKAETAQTSVSRMQGT